MRPTRHALLWTLIPSALIVVATLRSVGADAPSSATGGSLPTLRGPAPVPKFESLTAVFKPHCDMDNQLKCHGMFYSITQDVGPDPSTQPKRDYDVYIGATKEGNDSRGIYRGLGSTTSYADPVIRPGDTVELGAAVCLTNGFALVSGKAPMIVARRVRAVSDGTQFAIELVGDTTRVYLIDMASTTGRLRIAPDEKDMKFAEFSKADIGKYVEITPANTFAPGKDTPVSPASGSKEEFFHSQMVLLRDCLNIPRETPATMHKFEHRAEPRYETLLERFRRQCVSLR